MRLYTVDSSGGRWSDIAAADLGQLTADANWYWLDVPQPQDDDVAALAAILELPGHAVSDVLEPTEFPKMHEYDGALFAITHSPGLSEHRFSTNELDIFLTPRYLLTFHREHIPGLEWAAERNLASYPGPTEVMIEILEAGAQRYLSLLDGLDHQIQELEVLAISGHPEVLGRVQALRRDAILLRSLLAPERDMIRAMTRTQLDLSVAVKRQLESIYDDYFRIVESLDSARALLASVLDTYRSTVAERTNEVMKVLTVFAAIFLPLTLLAGIYGMNFANMPELAWRSGYFVLLAIMAIAGLGLWVYFGWRGFIGGPKIPRVDRAIGRGLGGLVHLTTAPVRGVIGLLQPDDDQVDDG